MAIPATSFPTANGRQAILRSVGDALRQIEQCAELAGENQELQALLDAAGDKLRRTMRDLRLELSPLGDLPLESRDLAGSLARLADHARQVMDVAVETFIDKQVGTALPPVQAGHVLQIVREALENAILHAGASRIALRAEVENRRLSLRLSDDGNGFDLRTAPAPDQGGLAAMRQRADAIRGLLSIQSAAGAGTIVTLMVPLRPGATSHSSG